MKKLTIEQWQDGQFIKLANRCKELQNNTIDALRQLEIAKNQVRMISSIHQPELRVNILSLLHIIEETLQDK
jgi:hypothetical protein